MKLGLPSLTIAEAATTSNIVGGAMLDWIRGLVIYAPAALAGVTSVEVADTDPADAVAGDFRNLQSGGSDVTLTADKATPITDVDFRSMRLSTTVAPGAGGEVYDLTGDEVDVPIGIR